jgi:hypothetical protein
MRNQPMWKLAFPGCANLCLYFISVYQCPSVVQWGDASLQRLRLKHSSSCTFVLLRAFVVKKYLVATSAELCYSHHILF